MCVQWNWILFCSPYSAASNRGTTVNKSQSEKEGLTWMLNVNSLPQTDNVSGWYMIVRSHSPHARPHRPELSNYYKWGRWVTWSYHSRLVQVHSGHHPPCPLELLPFTLGPPLDWPFGLGPPGPPPDIILPLLLPKVPPPPPMLPPPPEAGGGKVWPPPYPGGYP